MIPSLNIIAWGNVAPWAEQHQVEQDLVISRAIVELFSDDLLKKELRFRGGTALNKLHFPAPLRYSEDIDLVRTTRGPIKAVLGRVRDILQPWLGVAAFNQSPVAPKLIFRTPAEDSTSMLRLKIEINTREIEVYGETTNLPYAVDNPWFAGSTSVSTYSREEMLATKLRALLQRDKSRDLFDLAHALAVFEGLNTKKTVEYFLRYLQRMQLKISRAEAEQRMFAKLRSTRFLADMRPLLAPAAAQALTDEAMTQAFVDVFTVFVMQLPGEPWAKTEEMTHHFGLTFGRK